MKKRIVVQEELYDIRNSLNSLGYEVVDINENNEVEAIVYMADGYDIEYHNNLTNMNNGINMSNNKGTILINAKGKTCEEIDKIIKRRLYSPLFDWQQLKIK